MYAKCCRGMYIIDNSNLKYRQAERTTRIAELIFKYLNDKLDLKESAELERWMAGSEHNRRLMDDMSNNQTLVEKLSKFVDIDFTDKINARNRIIENHFRTATFKPGILRRKTLYIAASLLTFAGLLVFHFA